MLPKGFSLHSEVVEELYPFHILVAGSGGLILSLGSALSHILSNSATGLPFETVFKISRPKGINLTCKIVEENKRSSYVLKLEDHPATLRGQFVLTEKRDLLFLGSILVESSNSLEHLDIKLGVFPPLDLTPDVVILHKFRELELKDQQRRAQLLQDVSKSRDELNVRANTDELTNVANRRGFWKAGAALLDRRDQVSTKRNLLILLDLDGFKAINDEHGHEAGDEILQETARRLTHCAGQHGLVGRLGGDEFVIVLTLDESIEHSQYVQSLLKSINVSMRRGSIELAVKASAGITEIKITDTLESAIHHADLAMYEGRKHGRGKIQWFTDEIQQRIDHQNKLQEKLKFAISNSLITPYFQPIVSLADNKLVSFEALARWQDDELGMVGPDVFIAEAESLGLLNVLDKLILDKSLNQLEQWHQENKYYSIHVNMSAASLSEALVAEVERALHTRGLDARYLIFELTETTILEDTENARLVLEQLGTLGVKFQLDDFGTGYSSLTHIRDLPVNGIKIDRSFVTDAHTCHRSEALLASVLGIARNLDLSIVAEGIESAAQLAFLRDLGCQFGQGFYIGRPEKSEYCENLFLEERAHAA